MPEFQIYDEDIVIFSQDASKFVAAFMSVISHSAPHLYLSALPFAPRQSRISQHFLPKFPQTLSIQTGQATDWPAIQNIMKHPTTDTPVQCVAFSKDGKNVVSGLQNGETFIWDTDTGTVVAGPFKKHDQRLRSVTFSQDSKLVVSCADGGAICVWEVETGKLILEHTMHEPESSILSVACSGDGKCVVSCCVNGRIEICDIATRGAVRIGPFQSHRHVTVTSVACSWDARYIVSSSDDGIICVYDLEYGGKSAQKLNVRHNTYIVTQLE